MSGDPHPNRLEIGMIKRGDSADLHRPGQSSLHKHDVCQNPADFLRPVFGKLSLLGHHTWDLRGRNGRSWGNHTIIEVASIAAQGRSFSGAQVIRFA